ncbi:hypothetical protein Q5P01_001007 [Channa striata]|uniref:Uncharacterized protein n=1 Tax=Channa striata TaxID=64152 RepID=A0AA88IS87_CHASR|nr:hypothetical protein Q5P01_001007 [Channa striata]
MNSCERQRSQGILIRSWPGPGNGVAIWIRSPGVCGPAGAHVRLLRILLPRTRWKEVPVVVVLSRTPRELAGGCEGPTRTLVGRSGFRVLFYSKWSQSNSDACWVNHVARRTNSPWCSARYRPSREEPCATATASCPSARRAGEPPAKNRGAGRRSAPPGSGSSNRGGLDPGRAHVHAFGVGANLAGRGGSSAGGQRCDYPPGGQARGQGAARYEAALGKLRARWRDRDNRVLEGAAAASRPGGKEVRRREYTRGGVLSSVLAALPTRGEIRRTERSASRRVYCVMYHGSSIVCACMCVIKTFTNKKDVCGPASVPPSIPNFQTFCGS